MEQLGQANRSANLRAFFASYVTRSGRARDPTLERAFATVLREQFLGPGPWSINIPGVGYLRTPDDDIAFIYQNTLVALDTDRCINIGQPSAHARWLDALAPAEGEIVLQVGPGTGYYTAWLAHLVGSGGRVHAYEIDSNLAALHAEGYVGGMLLIKRPDRGAIWPARFLSAAAFISCVGPQDPDTPDTGHRLNAAFANGGADAVRSFRTEVRIDKTCWFKGEWLSTTEPPDTSGEA
jgi:protein-L-isoaspartate(D-aspartate) O-methyltransferase